LRHSTDNSTFTAQPQRFADFLSDLGGKGMKKLLACALCICACFAAVPAAARQTFHMADYWLAPHRTYTGLFTHSQTNRCPGDTNPWVHHPTVKPAARRGLPVASLAAIIAASQAAAPPEVYPLVGHMTVIPAASSRFKKNIWYLTPVSGLCTV